MSAPSPSRRDVLISKSLSYLLRHGAVKEGLDIDANGYVNVERLLQHQRLKTNKTTIADIRRIVEDNDKQRFSLAEIGGELKLCANQGHSIHLVADTNLILLNRDTVPKQVYHGTYKRKLPLIFASGGLSRMNRNHIHFASEISDVSGIRRNCDALIYVDVDKCFEEGISFYKSKNNVILTHGDKMGMIKTHLFQKIIDPKTRLPLNPEDYKTQLETRLNK